MEMPNYKYLLNLKARFKVLVEMQEAHSLQTARAQIVINKSYQESTITKKEGNFTFKRRSSCFKKINNSK